MKQIAVIGSEGFVGNAFCQMLDGFYAAVRYDPALGEKCASLEEANDCVLGVICVPTPMAEDGSCDTSAVGEVVSWLDTPVILVKSTVAPGTTDNLMRKYGKHIVMSPEYVGQGRYYVPPDKELYRDMKATPMVVLGGSERDCNYVIDLLLPILGPEKHYYIVQPIEAELIKYMANFFIGLKVTFANEMHEICRAFNANWYKVWGGWALDPRFEAMYTAVFPEDRGFGGKCLPKDILALAEAAKAEGYDARFVRECLASNERFRQMNNTDDNRTL